MKSVFSSSWPKDVVNSSPHQPDGSPTKAPSGLSTYFLDALPNETEYREFSSRRSLLTALDAPRDNLCDDLTRCQYLVFAHVPARDFIKVVDDACPASKYARVSGYDTVTGALVFKVRASPDHEVSRAAFDSLFYEKIYTMMDDPWEKGVCGL
ncbi:hypothetical protein VTN77DRAFT_1073 [Rasamsonia byssochlamydoides]|uniref:uncharacterized protein n=1 Tax=Rasamsonia byssochlamydoides TaxID=89139 RepID=UPI0037430EBA